MTAERLLSHDVHLWFVDFHDVSDALVARGAEVLDAEELARRDRFLFERDRRTYVISHAFLRDVLSRYVDVAPTAWKFSRTDHGRPEIDAPAAARSLRFNLSHTRGGALVGVVEQCDLGVDIESAARETSCVELADRYFSPSEVAELHRLPVERQRARFFEYWTLKEAYIKARGLGLAIPLDRFSYHLVEGEPIAISFAPGFDDEPGPWQFARWSAGVDLPAAAAVRRRDSTPMQFTVRQAVPFGPASEPVILPNNL
jgi:4'-phosphopantetheinyl transferase